MGKDEHLDAPPDHYTLTIERLTAGAGRPIVVVDFLQLSSARQLAEVLSARSNGHPVYRIDPVTDLARDGRYRPLDSLADGYADACLRAGVVRRELTVAGYCSAAALALLIAARLAGRAKVDSVLVQPTWPDAQSVASDFGSFRADLGAGNQPLSGLDTEVTPDMAARPDVLLEQMHDALHRDLQVMAAARGLDTAGPALADLLARYRAWLGFLLSSRAALQRPWPREMHPRLLLGAAAEPLIPWSDPGSYHVVRLQVPDDELLTDAALADTVLAPPRSWEGRAAR